MPRIRKTQVCSMQFSAPGNFPDSCGGGGHYAHFNNQMLLIQARFKSFTAIATISVQCLFQYNLGVAMMVFAVLEGIAAAAATALCWKAVWGCGSLRPLV